MEKLKEFMESRPHDKDMNFEDAVIEYIAQVENASVERSEKLKSLENSFQEIDEDQLVGYVMRKTSGHSLDYGEVRSVLDAELDYLVKQGIAEI